ncbi:CocE/NonD family hydrolase [Mycolicibacterium baixiangningiae]|uniref:CocE/NonD family hydrolase n=1 Tax=Mycolicibacterium baixiangningiae TaxID=2761578 RepID=UPI00186675BD|nr:CocE/NonD family hydrolase [Mycolicibacterium baixiangningiae]
MTPTALAGLRRSSGDAVGRLLGLPPRTGGFTVDRGVRVPMRDGVDLIADHYMPDTPTPAGTLLVRGPYGRGWPFSLLFAVVYARRGYHVVVQSVRGTFGSGGEFTPMAHEKDDGADTVVWLREQPWFTGSFATVGLSYLGFTQWALLTDPPPELKAAVIAVGPHDFRESSWGTGSFSLNDFLGWSDMVAHQEDVRGVAALVRQVRAPRALARATADLPLGEAGRRLLGSGAGWYESWIERAEDAAFWDSLRANEALDAVNVPILLFGGWQDLFLEQTLAQYTHLRDRGVPAALTVGAWTHSQLMTKGAPTVVRETLDWLGTHLGGRPDARRSPVRIEIHNDGWHDLPDWPPVMPEQQLFLHATGELSATPPDPTAPPSTFTFDPTDPTPTIGGRLLSPQGGYRADTRLADRDDVLTFTGAPLPADLYVVGTPAVELAHSCDNPHRDLFVRLSEVDRKGRSRNVTDGFRRLTGEDGTVRLELDAVAHRFRAGSRLRILVAGGSHPRFARNLGTGEPPITGRATAPATHTVHHGLGGVSRLVLPAGDGPPSAH